MNFLSGKKVLFIAPSFHNLQQNIMDEMISLGADVDYFDERPKNDFFTKATIRLKLDIFTKNKINSYYKNVFTITNKKIYDFVFLINLETITFSLLNELRKQQSDAKFILYMWDSLELKSVSTSLLDIFDQTFTFDYKDATERNMNFLDLFYSNEYIKLENSKKLYDLCFIGTIHGDRFQILKEVKKQSEALELKIYYYLYMPSKILFFFRKLFDKKLNGISYQDVRFKSLSASDASKIMNQSRAVLDFSYKNQRGLSMRTFEVLATRSKLITTHKRIVDYDFYHKNNIFILDKENVFIDKDFIYSEYRELRPNIYEKYSLKYWLEIIFNS